MSQIQKTRLRLSLILLAFCACSTSSPTLPSTLSLESASTNAEWLRGASESVSMLEGSLSNENSDRWQRVSKNNGVSQSEMSLRRVNPFLQRWSATDLGLAEDNISALFIDNDDVWAGTWTGGVIRFSEPLNNSTVWDPGVPSLGVRTVNRIARFDNAIWIVRYAAIERFDLRTGQWSVLSDLPANERLQDLLIHNSRLYLATLGHGLWVRENQIWRNIPEPGLFINRLEKGEKGEILVATMDRGLFIYKPASKLWIQPPSTFLRNVNVTSMLRSDSLILGGTYGSGAFIWDSADASIRLIDERLLGDLWVLAVAEIGKHFHFATFGAGLKSWHSEENRWIAIGIEEGLPSVDIASLASNAQGDLWVGTLGGGIVKLSGGFYAD